MKIAVIGVPLDLGADRRGVDMGPSVIRYAGLDARLQELGYDVIDYGNINVPVPESLGDEHRRKLKYLGEIRRVSNDLTNLVDSVLSKGEFPLILGGDHSVSIGSVAGLAKNKGKIGLLWFDAHGDFNVATTTPTGNIHGMPVAISVGIGAEELTDIGGFSPKVDPKKVVLIGTRSLDEGEKQILLDSEVTVFTISDIDEYGIREVILQALEIVSNGTDGVHLSFDMDVMDPDEAPGVGTPVRGGLTYREAHLALELIAQMGIISSLDVTEVNPILDIRNKSAELAVEFITSALGKRII